MSTDTMKHDTTREIFDELIELIDSKKGENIVKIDVDEISSIAKYVAIVTSTSTVHSKSLANHILDFFNEKKYQGVITKKPDLKNPWILIDAADIIIHIFLPETRDYYNLEKLYFKGKLIL